MPLPAQLLVAAGFLCFAASVGLTCAAWPRMKALGARGVLRKPVPDLQDEHRQLRIFELVWLTPIPRDRKRLRRMLLAIRLLILATPALMIAGMMVATKTPTSDRPSPEAGYVIEVR
ncbi:MAG: hypothetical protein REJ23_07245 [Brevundimonas sp.]|nr:hypothetical protein [Brevundimonas sp.]